MKKFFSFLAVFAVLLTGCKNDKDSNQGQSSGGGDSGEVDPSGGGESGGEGEGQKTLSSIAIKSVPPTVVVNTQLSASSVLLTATYSDTTSEDVTAESVSLDTSRVANNVTGTAYYKTLSANFTINVISNQPQVVTYTVNFFDGNEVYTSVQVNEKTPVNRPTDPTKDNYTFEGWYTSDDTLYDFDALVTGNLSLFAKWSTQEFEVTFHLNYDNLIEVKSTKNGFINYVPEREGYVFNGWWYCFGFLDNQPILNKEFLKTTKVTEEGLELYAEWVPEKEYANQLDTPIVTVDNYDFTWEEVENASSYNVVLQKGGVTLYNELINSTTFVFPDDYDAGTYIVKIRTIGDGVTHRNSSYVTKIFAHLVLTTPQNVSFNEQKCLLQWDEVALAIGYNVRVDSGELHYTTETYLDLSFVDVGSHTVRIYPYAEGYDTSVASYVIQIWTLRTPTNIVAEMDLVYHRYNVTWDSVVGATAYKIYINGEEVSTAYSNMYYVYSDSQYFVNEHLSLQVAAFDYYADYLISEKTPEFILAKPYYINYDVGYGYYEGEAPYYYTVDDGILDLPECKLYDEPFLGWNLNGDIITSLDTSIKKDVSLQAEYVGLNVGSNQPSIDVSISTHYPVVGGEVTVVAPQSITYVFAGWYAGEEKVSGEYEYTFVVPSTTYTLLAKYVSVAFTYDFATGGGSLDYQGGYEPHVAGETGTVTFDVSEGTIFDGWYVNDQLVCETEQFEFTYPSEDTVFVAKGHARDDIPYTVKHIRQDLNGVYNIIEEEHLVGTLYQETQAQAKNYEGFTCQGIIQNTVVLDGSTTVEIRYTRNSYTVSFAVSDSKAGKIGYNITFNYNDGTGETTTAFVGPDNALSYPTKLRAGYLFKGWCDDQAGTTYHDFSTPFNQDMNLYAKWEARPTESNVKEQRWIDAADINGSASYHTLTVYTQNSYTNNKIYYYFTAYRACSFKVFARLTSYNSNYRSSVTIRRAQGYNVGYKEINNDNYSSVTSSEYINAERGDTFVLIIYRMTTNTDSAGLNIYFSGINYPVSSTKQTSYLYGAEQPVRANTNSGYTFVGWYDGDNLVTTNSETVVSIPGHDTTFTAKWSKLTLSKNIEEAGYVTQLKDTYVLGDIVPITATSAMGYNFDGWYEGEELINNQPTINVTMGATDRTLEARWHSNAMTISSENEVMGTVKIGNSYTVTYDKNNGTDPIPVTVDAENKLGALLPTWSGHIFRGWYYDRDATLRFDPNTNITNDLTLYAAWQDLTTYKGEESATKTEITYPHGYNSKDNTFNLVSVNNTPTYRYFTCHHSGEIRILVEDYVYTSSKSNSIYIDNLTQHYSVFSYSNLPYNTVYTGVTHQVHAGDVIRIRFSALGYNSESDGIRVYMTGLSAYSFNTTVQSPAMISAGQSTTIVATPKSGYEFDGWYDGDVLVSTQASYTFIMPDEDVNYVAKFKVAS